VTYALVVTYIWKSEYDLTPLFCEKGGVSLGRLSFWFFIGLGLTFAFKEPNQYFARFVELGYTSAITYNILKKAPLFGGDKKPKDEQSGE